ncbi:hypothetical protein SARC_14374 [Sphaeroforma arctica JP610]|uniref:Uncharacterized protein n=1 Tax=Sphaeroforma arctica JP610 TaxID=667725 RepID=A0A0L0F965_9EUKA|nr:hypothetical protein SARC_14374 [Sphaeroforma arctica JP610]KNC73066.1 hypothetical protein SARC_14374 [Sphaeroforma arctica JP610]|eukprot:XP_014146968.1 hypothetical protein SARC_14374 [Sphaeroforma arctica JP610]
MSDGLLVAYRQLLYELFTHIEQGLQEDVLIAWKVLKGGHLALLLTVVDMFVEPDNFLLAADLMQLVVPITNANVNAEVFR